MSREECGAGKKLTIRAEEEEENKQGKQQSKRKGEMGEAEE